MWEIRDRGRRSTFQPGTGHRLKGVSPRKFLLGVSAALSKQSLILGPLSADLSRQVISAQGRITPASAAGRSSQTNGLPDLHSPYSALSYAAPISSAPPCLASAGRERKTEEIERLKPRLMRRKNHGHYRKPSPSRAASHELVHDSN